MSEFVVPQNPEQQMDMKEHYLKCLDAWADAGMNDEMRKRYEAAKKFLDRVPDDILPIFDARFHQPDSITLKKNAAYEPGFREARVLMDLAEEDVEFVRTMTSVKLKVHNGKKPIEEYVRTNAVLMRGKHGQAGNLEVIEMPLRSKTSK